MSAVICKKKLAKLQKNKNMLIVNPWKNTGFMKSHLQSSFKPYNHPIRLIAGNCCILWSKKLGFIFLKN